MRYSVSAGIILFSLLCHLCGARFAMRVYKALIGKQYTITTMDNESINSFHLGVIIVYEYNFWLASVSNHLSFVLPWLHLWRTLHRKCICLFHSNLLHMQQYYSSTIKVHYLYLVATVISKYCHFGHYIALHAYVEDTMVAWLNYFLRVHSTSICIHFILNAVYTSLWCLKALLKACKYLSLSTVVTLWRYSLSTD